MPAPALALDYFDGRSPRAQAAEITLAEDTLELRVGEQQLSYRRAQLRWPERQRHGQRQLQLPDGGLLSCANGPQWDAWAAQSGLRDSGTVGWMQSWRLVALSLLLVLAATAAGWRWGLPWAADLGARALPIAAEEDLGDSTLEWLDAHLLKPSELPALRRAAIGARLAEVTGGRGPKYRLQFRDGGKALGANAFALPGGDIVLTDALVKLMEDQPDAVIGVLGHELGHVQERHATRMLMRSSLSTAAAAFLFGDLSSTLAGASALMANMAYSRDFEREADAYSYQLMRKAGISPKLMVLFFQRIQKEHAGGSTLLIAISSHPADAERIDFFSR